MPATSARAAFVKEQFRVVQTGPNSGVVTRYGESARKSIEPIPTFFESGADAQSMSDERGTLLSGDRRQFNHAVKGESIGLALSYTVTAPQMTVIDDRRSANHPSVVVEFAIDFGKQLTTLKTWGGN